MEDRKEKYAGWLSVPQFGDWDRKESVPDYSLDFSKIRETRKQNKMDFSRASLENEEELINTRTIKEDHHHHQLHHQTHPATARRGIFSCFSCCLKA